VKALSLAGAVCIALGWTLSVWIPPIRYIYTVSFVFLTQGGALLLLAALYALTDIANVRRGTGLLILFGQCSLVAWMLVNFFGGSLTSAAERFVVGVPELIGTKEYQPVLVGVARMAIIVTLVWMWRRFRQGCRA
jgi:predicted acyltransferase